MRLGSLPPRLYKYVPPERIGTLEDHLFRYTPLGALNDPFEGRPSITALVPEAEALGMLRDILPSEARIAYGWLSPEARDAIPYAMFEELVKKLGSTKEQEMLALLVNLKPQIQSLLHTKVDELIGIFVLSEVPDSLLMWSHYAASHTGFVLGFNPNHPYFDQRISEEDEFRHLRRVVYRETRPRGEMTRFDGVDLFLVKSGHWAYEREWRILRPLRDAQRIIPGNPLPIHLFELPADALTEVIIGARATVNIRTRVVEAVRSRPSMGKVKVKQSIPDDDHFLLRFEDVAI